MSISVAEIREVSQRSSARQPVTSGDVAAFVIPLVSFVQLQMVGKLFATDLLLAAVFLWLAAKRANRLLDAWPQRIFIFAFLWLASQIVTDIVRQTSSEDYLRGWANIVFLITNFAAVYLLLRTDRRIVLFAIGFALSRVANYFVNPDVRSAVDPWKWGFAWPITICLVLVSSMSYRGRKPLIGLAPLALATVLNLHYDFRSMALFSFATLCCLALSRRKNARQSPLKLAIVVLSLAACGWGFQKLYEYLAASGALGDEARNKYEMQSGRLGLLLGGRSESLASIPAILDSPILGHGSWARDAYYADLLQSARLENGYAAAGPVKDDAIPSHSHILGAWVDAGVLGAVFWLVVLFLVLRGMRELISHPLPLRAFSLYCGFFLLWDLAFSPFQGERRFMTPVYLLLMILAIRRAREQQSPRRGNRQSYPQGSVKPKGHAELAAVGKC